jgi:mannosyltransferase OCH1-like enzyme
MKRETETLFEKIKRSIRTGDFWHKVGQKLHGYVPIFYVRNKNLQFKVHTSKAYDKLYKKYKGIIDDDTIDPLVQKEESDKIWICWFQGYEQAPELVKTTISSVRKNLPNYEVIVLTDENISQYAHFPNAIIEKRRAGKISAAHYSDLLRVELLCRYGGMWVDATVLCTTSNIPDYISKADLFVYKSLDMTGLDLEPTVCSSWFIAAKSNHPILLLTRKLLWQYWDDEDVLADYFLFHIFLAMAARKYSSLWDEIPFFNNASPHVLQTELLKEYSDSRWEQIKGMSVLHKLSFHLDYSATTNTFYQYLVKEYLEKDDE